MNNMSKREMIMAVIISLIEIIGCIITVFTLNVYWIAAGFIIGEVLNLLKLSENYTKK